ncbi:MAG: hypothetical protein PHH13_03670 [Candidatus Peribacteraceae bacterium]|nr:hypothetical protein [Candidatus Peribacteraceae bacterium]
MHPLALLKAKKKASAPPLTHPPQFPERLPGTLWGIAAYFNPASYRNRLINYRKFRAASRRQGLKLIVVEVAMDERPFDLANDDAEQIIQLHTSDVLWQKERLLSIALSHLPPDCDKVVWVDTDILFQEDDWIAKTCTLLEKYMVIQPFAAAIQLPRTHPTRKRNRSLHTTGKAFPCIAHQWAITSPHHFRLTYCGHPGYAVAARRRILEEVPFYDRMILGGGDALIMGAFLGIPIEENFIIDYYPAHLLLDAREWTEHMASIVRGSVSFVDGRIHHLWHGRQEKRYYIERAAILHPFDPRTDIRIDDNGCWAWATEKPILHEQVRHYFWARDEEGGNTPSFESLRIRELEKKSVNEHSKIAWLEEALRRKTTWSNVTLAYERRTKTWLKEMLENERAKNAWLEEEMTKKSALAEAALADERRKTAWLEEEMTKKSALAEAALADERRKTAWLEEMISALHMQNTSKEERIQTSPSAQRQPTAVPLFAQCAESFFDRRIPRLLPRGSRRRTIALRLLTWMIPS